MTPTPHLRFVQRVMEVPGVYFGKQLIPLKVLQQWWDLSKQDAHWPDFGSVSGYRGEWRDVPVEEESK
jgi:hypothetical protein